MAGARRAVVEPAAERDPPARQEGGRRVLSEPQRTAVEPRDVGGLGRRPADRRQRRGEPVAEQGTLPSSRSSTASSHGSPSAKAASAATTPSSPARSARSGRRATARRARSEAVTTSAALRPARLNAFDADVSAMPHARAVSDSSSHGVWLAPGRTSGAWISSASTQASCAAQRSAIRSSSARAGTCPVGLWGLASTSARAARGEHGVESVEVERAVRPERHLAEPQARLREVGVERRIRRRRERDRVARPGQDAAQLDQPGHHVGHERHLLGIDLPAEPAAGEARERVAEPCRVGGRVAEIVAVDCRVQRRRDRRSEREVHLGDRRDEHVGLVSRPLVAAPPVQAREVGNRQVSERCVHGWRRAF